MNNYLSRSYFLIRCLLASHPNRACPWRVPWLTTCHDTRLVSTLPSESTRWQRRVLFTRMFLIRGWATVDYYYSMILTTQKTPRCFRCGLEACLKMKLCVSDPITNHWDQCHHMAVFPILNDLNKRNDTWNAGLGKSRWRIGLNPKHLTTFRWMPSPSLLPSVSSPSLALNVPVIQDWCDSDPLTFNRSRFEPVFFLLFPQHYIQFNHLTWGDFIFSRPLSGRRRNGRSAAHSINWLEFCS